MCLFNKMESVFFCAFLVILLSNYSLWATPVYPQIDNQNETFTDSNGTAHDLYVIRTIIYEVAGILTDADNDTDMSNETHEQVDLTFYDPEHNRSAINLSNILTPIQTNVSGRIVTGLAPANFGVFSIPSSDFIENGTSTMGYPPFNLPLHPNVIISHTSNISTTDPEQEKKIIEGLPEELGV